MYNLEVKSLSELKNVAMGLDLLFSRVTDQLSNLNPHADKATELSKFFRERQTEIADQLHVINDKIKFLSTPKSKAIHVSNN